ncbi:MAG: sulfatase [Planctomyces sp.]|jgi:arylsulfatase A
MQIISMRIIHLHLAVVMTVVGSVTADESLGAPSAQRIRKPNFILMLADDQAWNGLSVAMHPEISGSKGALFHTPSLEKLAAQGMRFSAGYAPAPVCSPTRISLQTGKSPARMHWTKAAPPVEGQKLTEPQLVKQISASEVTIGEILKKAGYATAHYGKWHLNGGGPGAHGYDEHDGDTGNEQAFRFQDPNPVDIFGMAERAEGFMKKCSTEGRPFFIQLSWNALHASENALKATLAKYEELGAGKQMERAAMTEDLDTGVGRVLQSVEQLGLTDSTYVIYMSDNGSGGGGAGGNGRKAGERDQNGDRREKSQAQSAGGKGRSGSPLSGGKGDVYENGIRVPWIVRGPGIQPNSWCHTPVVGYDWFPTFCDLAGIDSSALPSSLEGGSLKALLLNEGRGTVKRAYDELIFHFPHYQGEDGPQSAIIRGHMKLMHFYEDDRTALFDLENDISERSDLSKEMPKETAQLKEALQKHLAAVDAQFPVPNPNHDPNQPATSARGKRGGGAGGGGGKKRGSGDAGNGNGGMNKRKPKRMP